MISGDEEMTIDRVDDNDNTIGPIKRSNIFREQANFRKVHVFVFNSKGQILLQKLAAHRELYPSHWGSSAAGYILSGESYDQAARRKLEQELGIRDANLKLVGKTVIEDDNRKKFITLYRVTHEGRINHDQSQIDEIKFLDLDQVDKLKQKEHKFTPTFLHLLEYYLLNH